MQMLNTNEAAKILRTTPQTLAKWRCTGPVHIPYYKLGRKVVYKLSDLEDYLSQHKVNE